MLDLVDMMAINTLGKNLSTHDWLTLKPEVRAKLIEIFQIPRSGIGHINYTGKGPEVTSDGHTYEDLRSIGIASMQQYLNSDQEDFFVLFNEVVAQVTRPTQQFDKHCERCIKDPSIIKGKTELPEGKLWCGDCECHRSKKPIEIESETDDQVKERWARVIQDLKTEAEVKGLLVEFRKLLTASKK